MWLDVAGRRWAGRLAAPIVAACGWVWPGGCGRWFLVWLDKVDPGYLIQLLRRRAHRFGARSGSRFEIVTGFAMRPARGWVGDHLKSLPPRGG